MAEALVLQSCGQNNWPPEVGRDISIPSVLPETQQRRYCRPSQKPQSKQALLCQGCPHCIISNWWSVTRFSFHCSQFWDGLRWPAAYLGPSSESMEKMWVCLCGWKYVEEYLWMLWIFCILVRIFFASVWIWMCTQPCMENGWSFFASLFVYVRIYDDSGRFRSVNEKVCS